MIVYSPLDGDALTSVVKAQPRRCFLMTRLGKPVPQEVSEIRESITAVCKRHSYKVVDAASRVTGRDFLLKIWKMIASTPLSVGICHEGIPTETQGNIFYELGVAQAMGKETLLVKSAKAKIPSDFVRTEYIPFNNAFAERFSAYLEELSDQADHYEMVATQLENNPVLAIDYLKRAYLITGDDRLRDLAGEFLRGAGLESRARNSVEQLAASF